MDRRTLLGMIPAALPLGVAAAAVTPSAIEKSRQSGIEFLRSSQKADGSWQDYPGITAVCAAGLLRNAVRADNPSVRRACDYLAALAKPSGAIYSDRFGPAQALPNYNTALSLAALNLTGDAKYREVIARAQGFLKNSQFDEGEGFTAKDRQYGGIGYGSREDNPDLSNLQNALEALKESGHPKNSEVFKRAIGFIQRCQNRSESNDQAWAGKDGGFVYAASGESKADEYTKKAHSSYGSMTYAGLKSYLYCGVDRKDPRVQAAVAWLRAHYSVTENPGMANDGLYYYYHTMSKSLALWGEKRFRDSNGKLHDWSAELGQALAGRQRRDGSWVNSTARWWEDRPELATGYAMISLAYCRGN